MAKKQKVTMYAQGDLLEAPVAVDNDDSPPAPPKEKKPRTPAQIAATEKLLALNKEKKRLRDEEKAKLEASTPAPVATPVIAEPPKETEPKKVRKRKPKEIPVPLEAPVVEKVDGAGATIVTEEMEPIPAIASPSEEPKAKRVKKNPKVKGAVSLNSIAIAPPKPKVKSETNYDFILQKLNEQNEKLDRMQKEKEERRIQKQAENEQITRIKNAGKQSWEERNDHFKKLAGDNIDKLTSSIFIKRN